jgi:hypothetical protein
MTIFQISNVHNWYFLTSQNACMSMLSLVFCYFSDLAFLLLSTCSMFLVLVCYSCHFYGISSVHRRSPWSYHHRCAITCWGHWLDVLVEPQHGFQVNRISGCKFVDFFPLSKWRLGYHLHQPSYCAQVVHLFYTKPSGMNSVCTSVFRSRQASKLFWFWCGEYNHRLLSWQELKGCSVQKKKEKKTEGFLFFPTINDISIWSI